MSKAKKSGHPLSEFVKIYPKKPNSFNHLYRCIYCIAILGEEYSDNQKFTNTAKCVKSYLKQSTNAESLFKKSNSILTKNTIVSNKIKLLDQFIASFHASENLELQAVFTFLNPNIKLSTCQNLARTILNNAASCVQDELIEKATKEDVIITLLMDS
ncbi:21924_t:CDS:2 [Dentiscutata erythropus]|uniref:21924_t:CDS:1 n=1 Tax=Dentiscutata erythropus TaxID=1348616 RepID=A0A9N9K6J9_9GLOM|nr:21924_t:CDS:2 [Dentiscutata erythropus]